ncbi:uncharacterized protein BXZ73DRAFT_6997, partial [Epithele typhae]|uniref:uncharacterized protein n=1 Tax=Epithele typhae TaxID=378194 RepID=UPI002008902A
TSTVPSSSPGLALGRDIAAELREVVDNLLGKKKDARQALQDENATLRSQVSLLRSALAKASTQPGSETSIVLAALEAERARRQNAEESGAATGRYLAEQIETVSKQKIALETALNSSSHGRDFWKSKAIAALERCEALEAENLMVKRQLGAFSRKHAIVVEKQISHMLLDIARERERFKLME